MQVQPPNLLKMITSAHFIAMLNYLEHYFSLKTKSKRFLANVVQIYLSIFLSTDNEL